VITRGDHLGLLWYAKPVLTRETPLELLSYAEGDNTFPHTSTIDQFFHTAQFKAYRDLGRHNAEVLIEAREALKEATRATYADFCATRVSPHWAPASIANLKLSEAQYGQLQALLAKGSTFATEGLSAMTAPERPRHAERWLTLRVIRGEWSPPGAPRITLTEYSQAWIAQRSLEPRTRELYESQLRNHVEPFLGRKTLDTITPQTIRSWRQQLLEAGRSATVAAKSYRLLRAVLNTAVKEDQLIAENPCRIPGYDKEVSPGGRWARFRR
jgi:integrase-like protein